MSQPIPTPEYPKCQWCDEPVLPGEEPSVPIHGAAFHAECALRQIIGSVGHIHGLCSCHGGIMEDDPALTKRQQAKAAGKAYFAKIAAVNN